MVRSVRVHTCAIRLDAVEMAAMENGAIPTTFDVRQTRQRRSAFSPSQIAYLDPLRSMYVFKRKISHTFATYANRHDSDGCYPLMMMSYLLVYASFNGHLTFATERRKQKQKNATQQNTKWKPSTRAKCGERERARLRLIRCIFDS